MEKMTLNETWKQCLAMWKWIAEQIRNGSTESVNDLKGEWLKEHGFEGVFNSCFFCDYIIKGERPNSCASCPGRLIDPGFFCDDDEYDYSDEPIKFYEKILALNEERDVQ